jgi:RNA polymerase sigma-70 factor (ECF subfamily)
MAEQRRSRPPHHVDPAAPTGVDTVEPTFTDARWAGLAATMARAVRRQCPAWLRDHAEDIAQSALAKVMTAELRAEGTRPLSSFYLYRAAHSALVDEIRRRKRRPEIPLEGTAEPDDQGLRFEPRAQGDPESSASFRELGGAVRQCLLTARRDRRLAVTLYLQGHSVPEAARILGWDPKRTENLVYRGLADLRQCLRGLGHSP